jgi:hypothetical protein
MEQYSNYLIVARASKKIKESSKLKVSTSAGINGLRIVVRNKKRRVVFMFTALLDTKTANYTVDTVTNRPNGEMWSAASGVTVKAEKLEEYVEGQIEYVIKTQNETKCIKR